MLLHDCVDGITHWNFVVHYEIKTFIKSSVFFFSPLNLSEAHQRLQSISGSSHEGKQPSQVISPLQVNTDAQVVSASYLASPVLQPETHKELKIFFCFEETVQLQKLLCQFLIRIFPYLCKH